MKICHTEDGIWLTTKLFIVSSVTAKFGSFSISSADLPHPKPKSQHQKFRAAQSICLRLASIVSESCGSDFDHKRAELELLQSLWEVGKTNDGSTHRQQGNVL